MAEGSRGGMEVPGARLAIDIGGTFTDVALEAGGPPVTTKVLTTPAAPEDGVLAGVRKVLGIAGVAPSAVRLVIHGTTLATNAIIERRGARTALIVTSGHRDALEMARENRFEQYDIGIDRPEPLVPRRLRLPVRERVDRRGRVLTPLDEKTVRALLPVLDEQGVESVAVGLIHGYANPDHERRIGAILAKERPELAVTLASEVCPEVREYERLSTACANAYVQPLMSRYLRGLARSLAASGLDCPFLLMTSGGGLTTLEAAVAAPVRLVESGPAGGAILASHLARGLALGDVLSFDMGGNDRQAVRDRRGPAPAVARLRGGPQLPFPEGERAAGAHSGDRDGRDRGRGRVDRGRGRPRPHPGGAGQRRVGTGAGGVPPGRGGGHRHRRGRRAGAHRSGLFRGGRDPPGPRPGGGRRSRPAGGETWTERDGRRARDQRDGGREHVQRGAHPRHRVGEGDGRPHPGGVRGLRAHPRRPPGGQARAGPLPGPGRRGGGVGGRVSAGADLLRGGAQPLHAPVLLRRRGGPGGDGGDAGRGGRGGRAGGSRGRDHRARARLHALRGAGPRDRGGGAAGGGGGHRLRGRAAAGLRRGVPGGVRARHPRAGRGGAELDAGGDGGSRPGGWVGRGRGGGRLGEREGSRWRAGGRGAWGRAGAVGCTSGNRGRRVPGPAPTGRDAEVGTHPAEAGSTGDPPTSGSPPPVRRAELVDGASAGRVAAAVHPRRGLGEGDAGGGTGPGRGDPDHHGRPGGVGGGGAPRRPPPGATERDAAARPSRFGIRPPAVRFRPSRFGIRPPGA